MSLILKNSHTEASTDGNNVLLLYHIVAYVLLVLAGVWWQNQLLSTGPSFNICWANCVVFLFFD